MTPSSADKKSHFNKQDCTNSNKPVTSKFKEVSSATVAATQKPLILDSFSPSKLFSLIAQEHTKYFPEHGTQVDEAAFTDYRQHCTNLIKSSSSQLEELVWNAERAWSYGQALRLCQAANSHARSRLRKASKFAHKALELVTTVNSTASSNYLSTYSTWIDGCLALHESRWKDAVNCFKKVLQFPQMKWSWEMCKIYSSYCQYQAPDLLIDGLEISSSSFSTTKSSFEATRTADKDSNALMEIDHPSSLLTSANLSSLFKIEQLIVAGGKISIPEKLAHDQPNARVHNLLVQAFQYAKGRKWEYAARSAQKALKKVNSVKGEGYRVVAEKVVEVALLQAKRELSLDIPWPVSEEPKPVLVPAKPIFYDVAYGVLLNSLPRLDGQR